MNAEEDINRVCASLSSLDEIAAGPPFDASQAVERARQLLAPRRVDAIEYPVSALGPLAEACKAIADHGQVRPAMVGQCLLGAASLLTQGHANVQSLAGVKPLSLYLLTLGDSGDGKSTAQEAALQPVNAWQRQKSKDFAREKKDYERALASKNRGADLPEEPVNPYRLVTDATVEGLRRDLESGPCSQGVFSDEAAAILSGYGMSQDNRAKTASVFTKLWDAGHLSVSRSTGGRVERHGCRLALHWLIQPHAASETIGDSLLSSLGFWPRFLLAWPEPGAPRVARFVDWESQPAVQRYWDRCHDLLSHRLPDDATESPVVRMDDPARRLIERCFEHFEREAKHVAGTLGVVKPFALRATEQICRVAGVLAAFADCHSFGAIEAECAHALVEYSLASWRRALEQGMPETDTRHALRLYEWLIRRGERGAAPRDISREGPHATRKSKDRDTALELLEMHALVESSAEGVFALPPSNR